MDGAKQLNIFDIHKARLERDKGIALVSSKANVFMKDAMAIIIGMPPGEYTGEDIRVIVSKNEILPHSPNAWGSLIAYAVRRKILIDTGKSRQMKLVRSHARRTPIYSKESQ